MKRFISVIIAVLMILPMFSVQAISDTEVEPESAPTTEQSTDSVGIRAGTRGINHSIEIDDSPAGGGYRGDYVIIYNPDTYNSSEMSTGNMSGLIQTSVKAETEPVNEPEDKLYKIDVDGELNEYAKQNDPDYGKYPEGNGTKTSYNVGDTRTFTVYAAYSPTSDNTINFKCLYVGTHCYIWTPVSSSSNTYPLDTINSGGAELAANEFDSKYDLMQSSFGDHYNGTDGDGKLHMLYYNIQDGWSGSGGYVAGFFYTGDFNNNGLPVLNIDTYPGVMYAGMDSTYSTMVHEYQHLINYSNTRYMQTWLNECFSAAAEEICYPGSSVIPRIQEWENYTYSGSTWLNPPSAFQYTSSFTLHNGFSMYAWNNNLNMNDLLALYGQVSLFAQYLYGQYGNGIYRQISQNFSYGNEAGAITAATGKDCTEIVKNFRVALTANATLGYNANMGDVFGFRKQSDYDPSQYNNVEDPYSLLAPVVFTGSTCTIKGGGAITVKPVNGVYNPPSDANSNLMYIGVKSKEYIVGVNVINPEHGSAYTNGYDLYIYPDDDYHFEFGIQSGNAAYGTSGGSRIYCDPTEDTVFWVKFISNRVCNVDYVIDGVVSWSDSTYFETTLHLAESCPVTFYGWRFIGWVPEHVYALGSYAPEYYEPGSDLLITDDIQLHALYVHSDYNNYTPYRLVTGPQSDWSGHYILTNESSGQLRLLAGLEGNQSYDFNSAGMELQSNTSIIRDSDYLLNVPTRYVFTVEPDGSCYSIRNKEFGTYLGTSGSSILARLVARKSFSSSCRWNLNYSSGCSIIENTAQSTYRYIQRASATFYFTVGSSYDVRPMQMWKELPADYATTPGGLIGDVDLNGVVNTVDALKLLRHLMNIELLSNQGLYNGDVDRSGNVNVTDCLNILRYAMHIIDSF